MPAPRHARPSALRVFRPGRCLTGTLAGLAVTAVAVPLAFMPGTAGPVLAARPDLTPEADGAHVQEVSPVTVRLLVAARTYTVRRGDTLSAISARVCGTPADYKALAYNNHLRNPDRVFAHQVLRIACHAAAAALRAAYPPPRPAPILVAARGAGSKGTSGYVAASAPRGMYSCSGLEALWDAAGGNPASARTAAAIAMAESGGNPNAVSPTNDYGLWQINGSNGALATLSPSGSARSAVILSHNGTNWSPWTTYTSGASAGRC